MEKEISADLVARIKNDDLKALGELYDLMSKKIYNRSYFILKDEGLAKDALHDIFLKVLKQIKTISDDGKIEQWTNTICYNHCIDILRKLNKIQTNSLDDNNINYVSSLIDDVDNTTASTDIQAELQLALDQLKEEERLIIVLHYWEGFTVKEIAEQMGIGQSAIKMKLVRTRDKLKTTLDSKGITNTIELFMFFILFLI
jgi:RNA polymerase sigma-70 factor (ECF subfamily)